MAPTRFSKTEYPDVTVLQYPEISIAALRNRGVQAASGEYLTFIDADCVIFPEYFDQARGECFARQQRDGNRVDVRSSGVFHLGGTEPGTAHSTRTAGMGW